MKILWCITGAGEFLKESIEAMTQLEPERVTVFMSRAGEEVLRAYNLYRYMRRSWKIVTESDYASLEAGKITLGKYDAVVVSPATANTVAKIANGIGDNLVTTAVSLALKTGIKVIVVPTDWKVAKVRIPNTLTPGGSTVHMKPRKSDIRNIRYLEEEGIKVLEGPKKLLEELQ